MTDREKENDSLIAPGAEGIIAGRIIVPDEDSITGRDDSNGPVPDDEETHDAAEEDDELLDPDSPDFDHSLRRRQNN
jgi:hypothetical protein